MSTFIFRRLLLLIPTVLMVSLIIFGLAHYLPGTILDSLLATAGPEGGLMDMEAWEQALGLDAPLLIQYGRWMGFLPQPDGNFSGLVQGDLGTSWWRGTPVRDLVAERWPVTVQLGFMAIIVIWLISLPVGIYSALRQDTPGDYISRSFAIACISVPHFWLGTLAVLLPALWWGYMAPTTRIPLFQDPIANLRMFIVPAIILGMVMSGTIMRMTRTMMLEVLRQDYIRTAWAKGLREGVVVTRHALKNALIPVITIVGLYVPVLIGGTVIIEQIFNLPGMGRLILSATLHRDETLIGGLMFIFAAVQVLINLVVDLTYAYLDPRIHFK